MQMNPSPDQIRQLTRLQRSGQLKKARQACENLLKTYPGSPFVLNVLGTVQQGQGQLAEAEKTFFRAIRTAPGFSEAHNNLGVVLQAMGHLGEAEKAYKKAIRINPQYAAAHNNLGHTLHGLGKLNRAVTSYDQAVRIRPDYAQAWNNRGVALRALGRLDEAVESHETAIRCQPGFTGAHRNLSNLKSFTPKDPHIPQMAALLKSSGLTPSDRINLNFALGKAHHEIGDHDAAFAYYLAGNRLRKQLLRYRIQIHEELIAGIKAHFTDTESLAPVDVPQSLEQTPIFILGMPRSGTTLVEQILASHSTVFGAGELTCLDQAVSGSRAVIQGITPAVRQSLRQSYAAGLTALGADEPYITDKMPLNFLWIGFILTALPEAKIVHVKREAPATCWSIFRRLFLSRGNSFAYDLEDVARFYNLYADLMAFWHTAFPGRIYDLAYETLTEHQETETRDLLTYCGLEWEDACMDFHKTRRTVNTASSIQVRQKIFQGSSREWRKYESHLAPMLKILNTKEPDQTQTAVQELTRLFASGRMADLETTCTRLLKTRPRSGFILNMLGAGRMAQGKFEQAAETFRELILLQPEAAQGYNNLGSALQKSGKLGEAVENYQTVIRIKPDHAKAHGNLGVAFLELGLLEQAADYLETALRLDPDFIEGYSNLTSLKPIVPGDSLVSRMETRMKTPGLSVNDAILLNFALGKAYDDMGDIDTAFHHFKTGNRMRKRHIGYDFATDRSLFARIREAFSSTLPPLTAPASSGQTPVFILGMPRSGTSLVEQILASHSRVYGAGELELLNRVVSRHWQEALSRELFAAIRSQYLSGIRKLGIPSPFITDKMPVNFMWIGFIAAALPGAKIIRVHRDARATCWSIFRQDFTGQGNGYAYALEDLAAYYRCYTDLMDFWHCRFPGKIYDLNYETLTESQEAETRKLLAHCGLDWEDRCLDFHETRRRVSTASSVQVRQPMYRGSSEAWQRYKPHLGPLTDALENITG